MVLMMSKFSVLLCFVLDRMDVLLFVLIFSQENSIVEFKLYISKQMFINRLYSLKYCLYDDPTKLDSKILNKVLNNFPVNQLEFLFFIFPSSSSSTVFIYHLNLNILIKQSNCLDSGTNDLFLSHGRKKRHSNTIASSSNDANSEETLSAIIRVLADGEMEEEVERFYNQTLEGKIINRWGF